MATVCLVSRVSRSKKKWVTHGSVSWQQYVLCPELKQNIHAYIQVYVRV